MTKKELIAELESNGVFYASMSMSKAALEEILRQTKEAQSMTDMELYARLITDGCVQTEDAKMTKEEFNSLDVGSMLDDYVNSSYLVVKRSTASDMIYLVQCSYEDGIPYVYSDIAHAYDYDEVKKWDVLNEVASEVLIADDEEIHSIDDMILDSENRVLFL